MTCHILSSRVKSQESDCACNFFRFTEPTKWNVRTHLIQKLITKFGCHCGSDVTRANCIDSNTTRAEFLRIGLRQTNYACFCRCIVGLTRIANLPNYRGNVDDTSRIGMSLDCVLYKLLARVENST